MSRFPTDPGDQGPGGGIGPETPPSPQARGAQGGSGPGDVSRQTGNVIGPGDGVFDAFVRAIRRGGLESADDTTPAPANTIGYDIQLWPGQRLAGRFNDRIPHMTRDSVVDIIPARIDTPVVLHVRGGVFFFTVPEKTFFEPCPEA